MERGAFCGKQTRYLLFENIMYAIFCFFDVDGLILYHNKSQLHFWLFYHPEITRCLQPETLNAMENISFQPMQYRLCQLLLL